MSIQRLKTVGEFRSMSIKPYAILTRRENVWIEIQTDELLPGDLVSIGSSFAPALAASSLSTLACSSNQGRLGSPLRSSPPPRLVHRQRGYALGRIDPPPQGVCRAASGIRQPRYRRTGSQQCSLWRNQGAPGYGNSHYGQARWCVLFPQLGAAGADGSAQLPMADAWLWSFALALEPRRDS